MSQTKSIDYPITRQVVMNDCEDTVAGQLAERQVFHYPPYCRMVHVYLKSRNEISLDVMVHIMAEKLRIPFENRILGPDKSSVARIQTLFIRKIVIEIEQNALASCVRELLLCIQRETTGDERFGSLIVYYDVNPT